MPAALTDHGRRLLAHLPAWWGDREAELVAEEGGPDVSVRSYDLETFTERLAEDPFTTVQVDGNDRALTESECEVSLDALVEQGLVSVTDGEYRITEAGHEALTSPDTETQVPGAVVVDLAPAQATLVAGGV